MEERKVTSLDDLELEFPVIDSNFRRFCASQGIYSVEDFLVSDVYVLAALADRQPVSASLKEGITQVLSIIDGRHQPWRDGVELLDASTASNHFLCTGCPGIDMLLGGGLREGELTELVGPSASGKTQVCLCTAAHVADRYCGMVIFLDTGHSFSSQRIVSVATSQLPILDKQEMEGIIKKLLGRIFCCAVYDIFALLKMLEQLNFTLKHEVRKGDNKLRLLVVDSVSSLVTPILGGKHSHGRSLMVAVGFLLKKLANENDVAVLITNHTVGEGSSFKPALGESWKSIPHVRLKLSRNQENRIYEATILKHSMMMLGSSAMFAIHDSHY